MDVGFRYLPETELEYLVLLAMYKTDKDAIWPIIHRWIKRYGLPKQDYETGVELTPQMTYFLRFLYYIRDN